MKRFFITICAALMLFACKDESADANRSDSTAAVSTSTPDSATLTEEWVPVDSASAMKAMMEAGTPGKEHAFLAKSNGTWKAETTMWMSPDAPPMKSTAKVTNKMIMGGRYQQTTFTGDMMGEKFEGTSTTGYDNARKVWTSSWIDNMSTGIMNMDGTWDEGSKTVTYTGQMICPANGKMCEMKQVVKTVDDNTQIMEMYGPDMKTGKLYKNMEIKLTKG